MTIYTIIVTYNAMQRNWIDRCMESLSKSTVETSVIIIDNGSTDGTREYVPAHYPDAVWMPQEKNLGFGQANNLGIRYALDHEADYVLLLNQDAAISPDALEKMQAVSDGESLLSPLHLNGDGTRLDDMFRYSLWQSHNMMNDDFLVLHQLAKYYESGDISAACWLMPVSIIRKIGGFNPLFFHYGEDNNYNQRLVYHGIKTLLVPDSFMYHDRQIHGNIQAYNHNRIHRDLLLEACNINQSFFKCLWNWTKILIRCYTKDIKSKQYRIGGFTYELLLLIVHSYDIAKSRYKEKQKGLNWL